MKKTRIIYLIFIMVFFWLDYCLPANPRRLQRRQPPDLAVVGGNILSLKITLSGPVASSRAGSVRDGMVRR